ncbi:MAG: CoA transferase [Gammaproteobacteria bacterium]
MSAVAGGADCPVPLGGSADRLLERLRAAAPGADLPSAPGRALLAERAALCGFIPVRNRSAGGTCRLLRSRDRILAVNLARAADWELMPAWLEREGIDAGDWRRVGALIARRPAQHLLDRALDLGLPVAAANPPPAQPCAPFVVTLGQPAAPARSLPTRAARVLDLSALWAGPLCGHLLHCAGADVVKVESMRRPDGARFGNARFYGLLNQGKSCVALDLATEPGVARLRALIDRADIVIEGSRPRALHQLGIRPETLIAARADLTWISITAYGREDPQGTRVGFGDDAGVDAGLSAAMREATGLYRFAGDAIADPLTGMTAAIEALAGWRAGGSRLVALALRDVAAHCLFDELRADRRRTLGEFARWHARRRQPWTLAARTIRAPVRDLGADTEAVFARWGAGC